MKKKITRIFVLVCALMMLLPISAFAAIPYSTYTYSIDGLVLDSPDAYVPSGSGAYNFTAMGLDKDLSAPSDIEADKEGNVYITDKGNNRIVVLDKYYKIKDNGYIEKFVNSDGVEDSFNTPTSTFVVDDGDYRGLYVCDKGNKRIVVFDQETLEFKRTIGQPRSELVDSYDPVSCVVDKYGRIYVAPEMTKNGILVMTSHGEFINFIGAPKVAVEGLAAILALIAPAAVEQGNTPTTYANLELDTTTGEFVYGTIIFSSEYEANQLNSITSKTSDYSPVRLLNANGTDIMKRNGFFAPAGEVAVELNVVKTAANETAPTGVSTIKDVSSGPDGVWSIIDNKRSKVYTYDSDGNLLYIFGDKGAEFGNIQKAAAITYQGTNIIVLDENNRSFTVYRRTQYAEILSQAIQKQNERKYDEAAGLWNQVLARNNNFDTAYVAMGKALYRAEQYEEAMKYFQNAFDTENYALAFKEIRADIMAEWFVLVIAIIIVAIVLLLKVIGWMGKVNKVAATDSSKRGYLAEFCYGMHLIFHPFDGYWDLKHEKRGSIRASITFIALTVIAFYYQSVGQGYYYNPQGTYSTVFAQISSVLIPFALFVISNWCFTTLFDGEGSLKDIFIATSYGLYPMPLFIVISTVLTNVLVGTEAQITSIIVVIAAIWMVALIIIGMQVTHDYSMGKNILTIIATIVGMVFIMFIVLLFTSLIGKMTSFVTTITSELSYR
ncbi:MAG: YIP1 family protein [Clostridia bacterium]|nr:YIP1 family protein [Clostridia bacterium]